MVGNRGEKMFEGNRVFLEVEKLLIKDKTLSDKVVEGQILRYSKNEELLHIAVEEQVIESLSLDAKYSCKIKTEENGGVQCYGVMKERYYNEEGGVGIFQIENGFYKILIE